MGESLAYRFLRSLLAAHRGYYDVSRDYEFAHRVFPGYAELHSHGEGYVLAKRAKLWEADVHEYVFFDVVDRLDRARLEEALAFMKNEAMAKVDPKPNHMTSYLSLVIIACEVGEGVARAVRHARMRKSFHLGLRGWANLRLAVVDLSAREVHVNGQGKDMLVTLEANMGVLEGRDDR